MNVHGAVEPTLTLIQQLQRVYERQSTTYTSGNVRVQIARTRGTGNTVNVPTLQVTLNDGGLRYLHKIVCVDSYDNELRIGDLGGRLGPNVIGKIKSLQHMLSMFVREYKDLVRDWDHALELRRLLKKAAESGEVVGDVEFREGSYRGFPYVCARFVGALERVLEFAFVTNDPERTLRTYTHPGRGAYLELSLKQLRRFRDIVDFAAWFREVAPPHFRPTAQAAAEPENTTNLYDPGEFNAAVQSLRGKTLQIEGTSFRLEYERRHVLGRPFPVLLVIASGSVLRFENLDRVISVYASKPKSFLFRFSFAEEEYDIGHTPQQLLKKLLAIPYKGVPVIKQFLQDIHSAEAAAEPEQSPELSQLQDLLAKLKGQEVLRIRDVSVSVVSVVSLITSPRPNHPVLALILGIHGPAGDVRGTTPYHVRVENGKYTVAESDGNVLGHVSVAVGARGILSVAATHLRKHLQDVYDAYAATEPAVNLAESFVRDLQRLAGQVGYILIEGEPVPLKLSDAARPVVYVGDVCVVSTTQGRVLMRSRGKEEELTGSTTSELSRKLSEFVLKDTESLTNPFRKLAKQLGNKTIKLVVAGIRIRIHYQEPYIIAESDKHQLKVYSIPGKVVVRSGGYPGQTIPAPSTKELALNLAKAILDLEHGVERGR